MYNLPKELLSAQLMDGLVLLVLGMGTVFVFLVILIYATKLMSKLCNRNQTAPAQAVSSAPVVQKAPAAPVQDDAAIAAAIAAAYDKSNTTNH